MKGEIEMNRYALISVLTMCLLLSCSCNKKVTDGDDEFEYAYQTYFCPAVSPQNSSLIAYYFNGGGDPSQGGIYLHDLSTGKRTLLLGQVGADGGIDFSDDNKWIVFSNSMVYKMPTNGNGNPILLASDPVHNGYCCFPDWRGNTIAFDIDGGPERGIHLMDTEGGNRQLIVWMGRDPTWSPDGQILYYQKLTDITETDTIAMEIYSFDLTSKQEKRLSYLRKDRAMEPAVSPSGNLIAFSAWNKGKLPSLFIMDKNGNNVRLLTSIGRSPVFISENKIIYSRVKKGDGDGRLYIITSNGNNNKPLF